jgi:hypothetical protein
LHLTLKREATKPAGDNLLQQQARFDTFMTRYNEERPHAALAMKTPAELYAPSSRVYQSPSRIARACRANLQLAVHSVRNIESRPHQSLWRGLTIRPDQNVNPARRTPARVCTENADGKVDFTGVELQSLLGGLS